MNFSVTETKYPENCLVSIASAIELILFAMETETGTQRLALIRQYEAKAGLYNELAGFKAYDLNYRPILRQKPAPIKVRAIIDED